MIAPLILAAAAAVAAVAPAPQGPELWRGARVGMTPLQVAVLFPQGRSAPPQLPTRPPVVNAVSGASAGWVVDESVFGRPGVATYYFAGGKLLQVVVSVKGLRLRHTRDNVAIARDVRDGLRQYYGPTKVCVDTARRGLDRLDCRWLTRSVQVGLSYVDYGGLGPNLDVAVRALPGPPHEAGEVFSRHGTI